MAPQDQNEWKPLVYYEKPSQIPIVAVFEGVSGSGKTTCIDGLNAGDSAEYISEGDLSHGLPPTIFGKIAKKLRSKWNQELKEDDGGIYFDDPDQAEVLAWRKYTSMLEHIRIRQIQINDVIRTESVPTLLKDRFIDTTIVYDAIDIIISNPQAYESNEAKLELLQTMWELASGFCDIPPLTIFLETNDADGTWARAHDYEPNSKYKIERQTLAIRLYPLNFQIRSEKYPNARVEVVNIDNMEEEEVQSAVRRIILDSRS